MDWYNSDLGSVILAFVLLMLVVLVAAYAAWRELHK